MMIAKILIGVILGILALTTLTLIIMMVSVYVECLIESRKDKDN